MIRLATLFSAFVLPVVMKAQSASMTAVSSSANKSQPSTTDLGTTVTFIQAFDVNISGCDKQGNGSSCVLSLSYTAAGSLSVSTVQWGTTSACGTNVPTNTGTPILSVLKPTSNNPTTSGSATIFVCSTAAVAWTTTPGTSFVPTLKITLDR